MNIAIISARMGSTRIPGKNIKEFHGHPIIYYPISTICNSKIIDLFVIATESNEIANIARETISSRMSCIHLILPDNVANDKHINASQLLKYELDMLKEADIDPIDNILYVYATNPFSIPSDLTTGFRRLQAQGEGTVLAITEFESPIQRSFHMNSDGQISMNHPEHEFTRSQDLPTIYHDAGQWFWIKRESFEKDPRIFQPVLSGICIPRQRVQDIDTEADWEVAKQKYMLI